MQEIEGMIAVNLQESLVKDPLVSEVKFKKTLDGYANHYQLEEWKREIQNKASASVFKDQYTEVIDHVTKQSEVTDKLKEAIKNEVKQDYVSIDYFEKVIQKLKDDNDVRYARANKVSELLSTVFKNQREVKEVRSVLDNDLARMRVDHNEM